MKEVHNGLNQTKAPDHRKPVPPQPEPYFDEETGGVEVQDTLAKMKMISFDFLDEHWDHPLASSVRAALEAAAHLFSASAQARGGEQQASHTHSDESLLTRQATWDARRKECEREFDSWFSTAYRSLRDQAEHLQSWLGEWAKFESARFERGYAFYHTYRIYAALMYKNLLDAEITRIFLEYSRLLEFLQDGFHSIFLSTPRIAAIMAGRLTQQNGAAFTGGTGTDEFLNRCPNDTECASAAPGNSTINHPLSLTE